MTNNTLSRLLVFFIGIPMLGASAFLFPEAGLPFFALIATTASALGAREAAGFFPEKTRRYRFSGLVIPLLGGIVPLTGYVSFRFPESVTPGFAVIGVIMLTSATVMGFQVFRDHGGDYAGILPTVTTHLFILIYPGLFVWHALRLVTLPRPSHLLMIFLLATYLNDSAAWFFGRLFGKATTRPGSPPPVAISPNKSMIGFIGGFLTSPLVILVAARLYPDILPGSILSHILFGALIGIATITGDLVESALKRSAAVKDSGQLVPGRGGLLDSIDSSLFAAPFFYYGYVLFFLGL
ncbi:MAG: phosphatidate cytidylyltransferase [Spirochaetaceae bacterium]|nr:MAG: phosphatidate cytidylyltransferase [Spirochaetaceae bacterium]